jgi:hypothetical protein
MKIDELGMWYLAVGKAAMKEKAPADIVFFYTWIYALRDAGKRL